MKWNWGTKLAIAMAAFMLMIIVFIILMMQQDVSLVERDYYPKGQVYQELIDKKQNAAGIDGQVQMKKTGPVVRIRFPEQFDPEKISGELTFYHRINDKKDMIIPLPQADSSVFIIDTHELEGRYILQLYWNYGGLGYYNESNFSFP